MGINLGRSARSTSSIKRGDPKTGYTTGSRCRNPPHAKPNTLWRISALDAFHGTKSDRLYLFSIIGVIVLTIGSVLYLTIQNYFFFVDKSEHAIIDESLHVALLTDNYFEKYRDILSAVSQSACIISMEPTDLNTVITDKPFYTTKPQGKGTGLGLSMVFGFVKRSGGEIMAESRSGEGTTITLLLPRLDTTPKKPGPDDREINSFPTANETILIVDDEKDLVELAKNYIEGWGYTAITANSGAEALQQLEASPTIDLLFTDVMMPGGTGGYELAQAAIRKHPDLKILFTSGFNKQADQNPSNFPASETLNKPYSPAELSSKLRHLLNC